MRKKLLFFILLVLAPVFLFARKVVSITVEGAINAVSAEFVQQAIEKAAKEEAECLLIRLNTPGGILASTRTIVSDIMSSEVPVIVYVAPGGAHAGSAGVFITMAADIAAMSPGTNIGAAHPVYLFGQMDSIMGDKMANDAIAFIKTIAENRNRNLEWAVEAVKYSSAITANEALDKNVIDIIATDNKDLLEQIHGKVMERGSGRKVTLQTRDAEIEPFEMGTVNKVLNIINDPNVMYVLFLIGIFGLVFEFFSPGAIFPGIIGVICLILAFYAMSTLPVNYAGVALIIFAVVLFVLEIKIVSHGMLGIGGVVALLIGSLMLIRKDPSFDVVRLSNWVIFTSVVLTSLLFLGVVYLGLKAQRKTSVSGTASMAGEVGTALETLDLTGMVRVRGEMWAAESADGRIEKGQQVRVVEVVGLKLIVQAG